MPEKCIGRIGLALLLALMLFPSMSKAEPKLGQESIEYCVYRGKLAIDFVAAVEHGYLLENVNIAWREPPADEGEEAAREIWVNALRAEVKSFMETVPQGENFAIRVGQKVAEKCAYEYGKGRVGTKVASSEKIKPEYRIAMCRDALSAHYAMALHAFKGMSQEEMHARIETRTDVPDEERLRIHGIVDELFDSGMNPQAWLDGLVSQCVGGV